MKPLKEKHKSLSDSVKTLTRQQFIILLVLALSALSYSWIKYSKPKDIAWSESAVQLPDSKELQMLIDNKVSTKTGIDQQVNNHLDDIIDGQAMQIKLSGLTKNITLDREPSDQEINDFYQQHKENYRQLSTFQFSQYLFPHSRYGAQAVNMAEKMLQTAPASRPQPEKTVSLNTLELNRLYGHGFSRKLEALAIQNLQDLPCWAPPVTSKVGAHLICFKQVSIGEIPEIQAIRAQLVNHWRYETAKKESANQ